MEVRFNVDNQKKGNVEQILPIQNSGYLQLSFYQSIRGVLIYTLLSI